MGGRGRPRKRVTKALLTDLKLLEELKVGSGSGKSPNGGNLHRSTKKQTPTNKGNQLGKQGSENTPSIEKGKTIADLAELSTYSKVDNGGGTTCNAKGTSGVKSKEIQENLTATNEPSSNKVNGKENEEVH